ncbi:hypothetical protein LCGC14_1016710 [marine sediment metagenome]|uniref:Thymidylate synthase/dCMP hydroxymethylase domain-containing protein n=1 Tax=marine sediment metagenome TaxID=412755 RepID=A0A0F9QGV6_9ZZZZ
MLQTISISKHTVGEAWLESLIKVINNGNLIKTEYDKKDDPPSFDATVMINVKYPLSKPIKRNGKILTIKSKFGNIYKVYGSIADIYLIGSIQSGYIEEIVEGVNDYLIQESETSYPYSYHDRIFNYSAYSEEDIKHVSSWFSKINCIMPRVNQMDYIIKKLKQSGYSRRAQAITWRPYTDPYREDGPCLQRLWCRIIDNKLVMTTTWRSRDLFKAWEANVNGMIQLQKIIAKELKVEVGNYIDISNSLHIYGKDLKELANILVRILIRINKTVYRDTIELQLAIQRLKLHIKNGEEAKNGN